MSLDPHPRLKISNVRMQNDFRDSTELAGREVDNHYTQEQHSAFQSH